MSMKTRDKKFSRRTFLAGGATVTALVAVPDLAFAAPATPASRFFLYGATEKGTSAAMHGWKSPTKLGLRAPTPSTVATDLAALPVKAPDGSAVAIATVEMAAIGAAVTLTLVSTDTGGADSAATLELPGVPQDALVLVTPVFATGAPTVAVVMAVSVPTQGGMFAKVAADGTRMSLRATSWTTHHQLAYLDRRTLAFTGPFDLATAPSLAWTDAAADATHLYLWTMKEPAAAGGSKTRPVAYSPPRLMTYPLGSGEPSLSLRSPGAWPAGQTGLVLRTAEVVRMIEGRDLEVFSPKSGKLARMPVERLDIRTAKPGATNVHTRPDGTLVVANAAMGRAVVVDPAASFATTHVVDYPRPAIPLGGPDAKTALSPDGSLLYTLGPADTGGLSAYDIATGKLVAADSSGAHYSGIYQLPGGSLLAVNGPDSPPQLSFFTQSFESLGTSATNMHVAEVF